MKNLTHLVSKIHHVLHGSLLRVLLSMYVLAVVFPKPGIAIRNWHLPINDHQSILSFMLGILLFNAGIGLKTSEFKNFGSRIQALLAGLFANFALPLVYVLLCSILFEAFSANEKFETLLVGIALIGSMPIAGASATWSQEANGNLALSLGLVFFSTLLSPLLSPLSFHIASFATVGSFKTVLLDLAHSNTSNFLFSSVVAPTFIGIVVRFILSERARRVCIPYIKIISVLTLMILNYSNASVAMPQAFANPDYTYLASAIAITSVLCLLAFVTGFSIAKLLRIHRNDQASLVFGLGMNNNGTGLVFASLFMGSMPGVLLPIVLYNLEQQIFAGIFQRYFERRIQKSTDPQKEIHAREQIQIRLSNAAHAAFDSDSAEPSFGPPASASTVSSARATSAATTSTTRSI